MARAALLSALLLACGGGRVEPAPPPPPATTADDLLAVLESCSDRDKRRLEEADWQEALAAAGSVHVRFGEARTVLTAAGTSHRVTEILAPGPGSALAGFVLARDGETLYSPFLGCDESRLAR